MTIEQWIEENIKPNVLAVHKITPLAPSGQVKQYDVSVLITTETGTNIVSQPVNELDGKFYFGNRIIKNYEVPETIESKEVKIKQALTAIKAADPNASYVGIDTSNDLTVVKLKVGGVIKGYSLLDGELIELVAE